jgi:hypothetical protein
MGVMRAARPPRWGKVSGIVALVLGPGGCVDALGIETLTEVGPLDAHPPECQQCGDEHCSEALAACAADPTCSQTVLKALGGGPRAIEPPAMLALNHAPRDRVHENELYRCLYDNCGAACGFDGGNFSCRSRFSWPTPRESSVKLDFFVRYFDSPVSGEYLPRALVEFCDQRLPSGCYSLAELETEVSGYASATIPIAAPLSPFQGFVQVSVGSSGKVFYTTNVYHSRPISTAQQFGQYVIERSLADAIASGNGFQALPGHGVLGVIFLDCAGEFAPGIVLHLAPGVDVEPKYIDREGETGARFGATAFDIPAGCHEVVGTRDGEETHRARVVVAPSPAVTVVYVDPLNAEPLEKASAASPTSRGSSPQAAAGCCLAALAMPCRVARASPKTIEQLGM